MIYRSMGLRAPPGGCLQGLDEVDWGWQRLRLDLLKLWRWLRGYSQEFTKGSPVREALVPGKIFPEKGAVAKVIYRSLARVRPELFTFPAYEVFHMCRPRPATSLTMLVRIRLLQSCYNRPRTRRFTRKRARFTTPLPRRSCATSNRFPAFQIALTRPGQPVSASP